MVPYGFTKTVATPLPSFLTCINDPCDGGVLMHSVNALCVCFSVCVRVGYVFSICVCVLCYVLCVVAFCGAV